MRLKDEFTQYPFFAFFHAFFFLFLPRSYKFIFALRRLYIAKNFVQKFCV